MATGPKTAVLPTAKEAIESLLTILQRHSSSSNVSAETLRLGKHDMPDAYLPLWNFLHDLMTALFKPIPPNEKHNPIDYVKTCLVLMGYPCQLILPLRNDKGSSRELLLALGWLLAHFGLPSRLFPFRDASDDASVQSAIPSDFDPQFQKISESALNELKRLQWEIGKLRLSWRKLIQLRLQKLALEKRVCEATKGKGLEGKEDDCLSVEEAMILSQPGEFQGASLLLDDHLRYLKAWHTWKEGGSKVFWKWMESVIEAKAVKPQESISDCDIPSQLVPALKTELNENMKNFHEFMMENETRLKDILSLPAETEETKVPKEQCLSSSEFDLALDVKASQVMIQNMFVDFSRAQKQTSVLLKSLKADDDMPVEELQQRIDSLKSELTTLRVKQERLLTNFSALDSLEDYLVLPPLTSKATVTS